MSRFKIEERVGCIAIVDTEHVEYINNRSPGMNSTLPYVVWYSNGIYDDDAGCWRVIDSVKLEAKNRLNYFRKLIGETEKPIDEEYGYIYNSNTKKYIGYDIGSGYPYESSYPNSANISTIKSLRTTLDNIVNHSMGIDDNKNFQIYKFGGTQIE